MSVSAFGMPANDPFRSLLIGDDGVNKINEFDRLFKSFGGINEFDRLRMMPDLSNDTGSRSLFFSMAIADGAPDTVAADGFVYVSEFCSPFNQYVSILPLPFISTSPRWAIRNLEGNEPERKKKKRDEFRKIVIEKFGSNHNTHVPNLSKIVFVL